MTILMKEMKNRIEAREDAMPNYRNMVQIERTGNSCKLLRELLVVVIFTLTLLTGSNANYEQTRHYEFNITSQTVTRICNTKQLVSVNGQYPGPNLHVTEGDRLIIKVNNFVKSNVTLHWHGIRQLRNGWVDGPSYVTQCPIQSGRSYTYNFTIVDQRGTLWWHAHISWLRATVYGALIIHPKKHVRFPFPVPYAEVPLLIGEWWNSDVETVLNQALASGAPPNNSDAYTINGQPGALYNCSAQDIFTVTIKPGKSYLLRIINSALNTQMFFGVANHTLTVVEADALYTKPFPTSAIVIAPGQTTTVLLHADQTCGQFYAAAHPYASAAGVPFNPIATTAIFKYEHCSEFVPILPDLPQFNDTVFANSFDGKLRSLATPQFPIKVPKKIDRRFLFTVGLAVKACQPNRTCAGPFGGRFAASINNVSFVAPTIALLQAHFFNIPGVFTTDFPSNPPFKFNFTGQPPKNLQPTVGTKAKVIPFGKTVQIVFQDTSILATENHPLHLHGYNFFVVGRGFGNFKKSDEAHFNLVDPPERNTIGVPVGGWAAIRFKADNPGIWFTHCHLDVHSTVGLEMALLVQNGHGPLESVQPPPKDLPPC
ncbi:hypothetical protein O6H91_01G170300 [Diphasiastrum complanatum]|uniref:Uncharacterized protein n=1 Tax=Diphasiastrum complanatum TaxID=34168 RepID=A0ACC2EYV3_DIPCM|nr:hypothetical protein O6H91_01G170300 [Diphasiastrum complanatum]